MTMELQVETLLGAPPDNWPPIAHIARKPITEKSVALCGEKLMGLVLNEATQYCQKCVELFKEEMENAKNESK